MGNRSSGEWAKGRWHPRQRVASREGQELRESSLQGLQSLGNCMIPAWETCRTLHMTLQSASAESACSTSKNDPCAAR